jgi:ABC-type nitrate/sulfonate/bicarbonate transport system substrate-binding protein
MAAYQYHANKIVEHLFQGGIPPEGDALSKAGFHVLVLAAAEWQAPTLYTNITVIGAPGDDDPRPDRILRFVNTWRKAGIAVAEHVREGRNVLVTCMAGQNRSGMVTAFALRELTQLPAQDIISLIQAQRPMALCNSGFVTYLLNNI